MPGSATSPITSRPATCSWSTRRRRCPPPSTPSCSDGTRIVVHVSTQLPGGLWMVEPRRPLPGGATSPLGCRAEPTIARLVDGTAVAMLRPAAGFAAAVAGDGRQRCRPADGARRRRPADPLLVRRSRLADRQLPDRVRRPTGQRRDAERGPPVHGRPHDPVDPPRHRDRHDHAPHRCLVARGSRVAVRRTLRGPAGDRGRDQRDPVRRRPRDRRRHHGRAGPRVGGRRDRHRASGRRLDRRRGHARRPASGPSTGS